MGRASVCRLKLLIRLHGISVLVLIEPLAEAQNIEAIRRSFSFEFCLFNSSNKIWILWRPGFHFHILYNSEQMLHVMVAHDSWAEKRVLWSELDYVARTINRPWLVGGGHFSML